MIAAVVITQNEEGNIERCLRSLTFCDEIIVVDAESTDRTVEIAKPLATKVAIRPWSGYADQKNFANSLAQSDWVLSIDADEEISPSLREEILGAVAGAGEITAYSMPRKTIQFGRWIRHGGWYPNRLMRLFRKSRGKWIGNEVHEFWDASGITGALRNDLLHYSFAGIADQVERNNHYSSLGAKKLKREGKSFSSVVLVGKSLSKFLETYLLKMGFLDGYPGFIISVSAAYSVFLKWAKLWELQRGEKN